MDRSKQSGNQGIVNTITSRQQISDPSLFSQLPKPNTGQIKGLKHVMHCRDQQGYFNRFEEWESQRALEEAAQQSVPYRDQLGQLEQVIGPTKTATSELLS